LKQLGTDRCNSHGGLLLLSPQKFGALSGKADPPPSRFRTFQAWPKDLLTLPLAGWKRGKRTAAVAARLLV
jgi:hypothetical protein